MLFLRGARQLVTVRGPASARRGSRMRELGVIRDGSLLINGEKIEEVGRTQRIANLAKARGARVIDVAGKVVIPGFVDAHTHLSFARPGLEAFERRIAGAPSPPRSSLGPAGSIHSTPLQTICRRSERWLHMAAAYGAATAEVRTRRHTDPAAALKELRAVRSLDRRPLELTAALTVDLSREDLERPRHHLKVLAALFDRLEDKSPTRTFDLDCTRVQAPSDAIVGTLQTARDRGYLLKVQAARHRSSEAVAAAVALGVLSVDHAVHLDEHDVDLLADSESVATLLPGLAFEDGSGDLPPARRLIDSGAAVALASGFGAAESAVLSMPLVMSLACRQLHMMPEETIAATTINAAAAIGVQDRLGSLEPGKQADVAVFDVEDYREIPYYLGLNLCVLNLKKGAMVFPDRLPEHVSRGPSEPGAPQGSEVR